MFSTTVTLISFFQIFNTFSIFTLKVFFLSKILKSYFPLRHWYSAGTIYVVTQCQSPNKNRFCCSLRAIEPFSVTSIALSQIRTPDSHQKVQRRKNMSSPDNLLLPRVTLSSSSLTRNKWEHTKCGGNRSRVLGDTRVIGWPSCFAISQ